MVTSASPAASVMASTHVDLGAVVRHGAWDAAFAVRERALKALEEAKAAGIENPLDAGVMLPASHRHLEDFLPDLADLFGVSRVVFARDQSAVEIVDLRAEPRCERSWKRDGTVRQRSDGGVLSDRDAEAVGVS